MLHYYARGYGICGGVITFYTMMLSLNFAQNTGLFYQTLRYINKNFHDARILSLLKDIIFEKVHILNEKS